MFKHFPAAVVHVFSTDEIYMVAHGSYAAHFACGEAISLDPHGREANAEVLCENCARRELPGYLFGCVSDFAA